MTTLSHLDTAVILAGGQGLRTRPLTDSLAKPMISVAGKPFLERLIVQMRDQGIHKFILLLGYLPHTVTEYFGDGSRWNVRIDYSISDVSNDTGKRLHLVKDRVPEHFLLAYCDNYWPMDLSKLWEQFIKSGSEAQLTVYSNTDGYTKNNVRLAANERVIVYDKSRSVRDLRGVDIGYAVLKRQCLEYLSGSNDSFESVVYMELVRRGQLGSFLTHHRYYSIGSLERVQQAIEFFSQPPTVILDRDGTLNERPPRGEYVRDWNGFRWLPGVREGLRLLKDAGYRVIVVTNQAGIARGRMTQADLTVIHQRMTEETEASGGRIDRIYCCPHHWDEKCFCRKPSPGMFFEAQRDFDLDLSRVIMLGDDERDGQAALAAGCPWRMVSEEKPLIAHVREITQLPVRTN